MKCEDCPALWVDGYEYPQEYCGLEQEEIEFKDGSIGCNRKLHKIKKLLSVEVQTERMGEVVK